MKEVYIVSMARTPIGSLSGSLSALTAVELGKTAIEAAIERAGISGDQVQEVIMGNVLTANVGQAPARQAALAAGVSNSATCTTVNKVCASCMKAIALAAQSIMLGDSDIVVAGGMESMSKAPFYIPTGRTGIRYGNGEIIDAIVRDGLQDPYKANMMGNTGEICAAKYNFTREKHDAYAVESYRRAQEAYDKEYLDDAFVSGTISTRRGEVAVRQDEEVGKIRADKVSSVRPAFQIDGTVTAIYASNMNDRAAATVSMSKEKAEELVIKT